jgi:hypothetical protein
MLRNKTPQFVVNVVFFANYTLMVMLSRTEVMKMGMG